MQMAAARGGAHGRVSGERLNHSLPCTEASGAQAPWGSWGSSRSCVFKSRLRLVSQRRWRRGSFSSVVCRESACFSDFGFILKSSPVFEAEKIRGKTQRCFPVYTQFEDWQSVRECPSYETTSSNQTRSPSQQHDTEAPAKFAAGGKSQEDRAHLGRPCGPPDHRAPSPRWGGGGENTQVKARFRLRCQHHGSR